MASSSSPRYDIFLCFCCRDVACSGFVSHLSAAFRRKDLRVFGVSGGVGCQSEASPAAIEGSRVSVVVISEGYASCQQCLDKLVEALKCWRDIDSAVVPVFYRVSPSDVHSQTGELAAVFADHERSDAAGRVITWRAALRETTNIPGHEKNDLWDYQLVDAIVRDVSQKLFTTDETNLIGTDWWLQKVDQFGNQSSGFHGIGIWGMGGIGKTTIAQAMFKKMCGKFEDCYFLHNFDERLREEGLSHLQEKFFAFLLEEKLDTSSLNSESSFICDRLRSKKVLVALDDVHNSADIESLVGGFDWFGSGSVIIITSRDKQVLVQCQIHEIHQLEGLNEHDALQLFSRHAFGKDMPENDMLELSRNVVEYADGNPLALQLFGETVKDMLLKESGISFFELKQLSMRQVLDVLRSSYDALNAHEKNIFLDIACFFKGEDVGRLINLLEGCNVFPSIGINILVDKSLVTISNHVVEMHNLIQDMGREIVLQESEEPENLSRLWNPLSIGDVLVNNKGSEATEGIFFDASELSLNISPTAFENTYNLRLLKIYGSNSENNGGICLPHGLASLPGEIRLLHWENYPLKSLPQDFDSRNLVELNLPQSNIARLWEGTRNLKKLKKIRLTHSQHLIEILGLSEAQNLEYLDLTGCGSLRTFPELSPNIRELYLGGTGMEEIPSSIENAFNLARLDLENCRELKNLPTTICKLKSLEQLNLSRCLKLERFPEITERMGSLRSLDLSETAIMDLPSSISNLIALEEVSLRDCRYCLKLLDSLSKLKTLKQVKFDEKFYASSTGGFDRLFVLHAHASLLYLVSTPYFLVAQSGHVEIPKDFFHGDALDLSDLDGNELKQLLFSVSQHLKKQNPVLFTQDVSADEELSPYLLPYRGMQLHAKPSKIKQPCIFEECLKADLLLEGFARLFVKIWCKENSWSGSAKLSEGLCFPVLMHLEWSALASIGYSAFLHVPRFWPNRNPIAFAFLVVIPFQATNFFDVRGFSIRCTFEIKTSDSRCNFVERIFHCWSEPVDKQPICQDYMFIFYDFSVHKHLDGVSSGMFPGADFIFKFYAVDSQNNILSNYKVKGCAVYMITAQEKVDKIFLTTKRSVLPCEEGDHSGSVISVQENVFINDLDVHGLEKAQARYKRFKACQSRSEYQNLKNMIL